ncbi:MAG: hypothetical protein QJR00_03975 [Bacillota bacterium]|nr:hypothetical protein [Bacillota bacterium]
MLFLVVVAVIVVVFAWLGRMWLPRRRPMGPKWAAQRFNPSQAEEEQKA